MTRQVFILIITLALLAGSPVTAGATLRDRDDHLRGYVDATRDSNLPYRIPHLGINADLIQYSPDELAHQLDLMRAAHITWVRQPFRWHDIEVRSGLRDWAAADIIVQAFTDDPDLKLIAVLTDP